MSVLKPLAPRNHRKNAQHDFLCDSTTTTSSNKKSKKAYIHPTLGYAIPPPVPAKVARRNARERNRVKQVNGGFEMLRSHIPSAAKHKKMSKVDTLRHAVDYIQTLQRMLKGGSAALEDEEDQCVKGERVSPPPSLLSADDLHNNSPVDLMAPAYESGYETSSYYSASSMISPVPQHHQFNQFPHQQQQQQQQQSDQTNVVHFPSAISERTSFYYDQTSIDPNSEEDELLDAIANWQDDN